MRKVRFTTVTAATVAAVSVVALSACSSNSSQSSASTSAAPSPTTTSPTSTSAHANPAADLVGPGCADYANKVPSGPGSVAGMAQDPVAVAASNNPLLTTLTSPLPGKLNPNVNLVDTLNNGQFSVFAPPPRWCAAGCTPPMQRYT